MCAKHGLILTQASRIFEGKPALETLLRHPASGQWIASQSLLTVYGGAQSVDQAWGGSSTYHRRYDAMVLLGIFAEDDPTDNDGEIMARRTREPARELAIINAQQLALLNLRLNGNVELEQKILKVLNIERLADIPWKEFNRVLHYLERN